jgi:hypothetical protein
MSVDECICGLIPTNVVKCAGGKSYPWLGAEFGSAPILILLYGNSLAREEAGY